MSGSWQGLSDGGGRLSFSRFIAVANFHLLPLLLPPQPSPGVHLNNLHEASGSLGISEASCDHHRALIRTRRKNSDVTQTVSLAATNSVFLFYDDLYDDLKKSAVSVVFGETSWSVCAGGAPPPEDCMESGSNGTAVLVLGGHLCLRCFTHNLDQSQFRAMDWAGLGWTGASPLVT